MKNQNLILGFVLFALGLSGVLSLLTMDLPIPKETMDLLLERLTLQQIKLATLIQPLILLVIAILVGVPLHKKVELHVPVIERQLDSEKQGGLFEVLKYGILGGVLTGILSMVIGYFYYPFLPNELKELGENFRPTLAVRFLYGGFTEEIIFRFGLMTLIVWLASKIFAKNGQAKYWLGISVTSILFSLAHLPATFQAVEQPSIGLVTYLLIATSLGGMIFGWLYWKKGLESAFLAHACSHIVIVAGEPFLS